MNFYVFENGVNRPITNQEFEDYVEYCSEPDCSGLIFNFNFISKNPVFNENRTPVHTSCPSQTFLNHKSQCKCLDCLMMLPFCEKHINQNICKSCNEEITEYCDLKFMMHNYCVEKFNRVSEDQTTNICFWDYYDSQWVNCIEKSQLQIINLCYSKFFNHVKIRDALKTIKSLNDVNDSNVFFKTFKLEKQLGELPDNEKLDVSKKIYEKYILQQKEFSSTFCKYLKVNNITIEKFMSAVIASKYFFKHEKIDTGCYELDEMFEKIRNDRFECLNVLVEHMNIIFPEELFQLILSYLL